MEHLAKGRRRSVHIITACNNSRRNKKDSFLFNTSYRTTRYKATLPDGRMTPSCTGTSYYYLAKEIYVPETSKIEAIWMVTQCPIFVFLHAAYEYDMTRRSGSSCLSWHNDHMLNSSLNDIHLIFILCKSTTIKHLPNQRFSLQQQCTSENSPSLLF